MFKKIEGQLKLFTEGTGLADRHEIVHGTLYVKLKDDKNCDFFHAELRGFYRQFISADGGVNMYAMSKCPPMTMYSSGLTRPQL